MVYLEMVVAKMTASRRQKKVLWQRLPGLKLKAYHDGSANFGFSEEDMDPIQHWCWANMPTVKRMSFDTWLFKSEKQITMFLMKWS